MVMETARDGFVPGSYAGTGVVENAHMRCLV